MHLKFRNINDAFKTMVTIFGDNSKTLETHYDGANIKRTTSRNGDVLLIDEPVILTYTHPRERVLFNQARDANPFFHLYEALWMLAGRNDVTPLAYYNSQMAKYSDDGQTFNGAYGYRWRNGYHEDGKHVVIDQLEFIINHLKKTPDSRRAVLQMWNTNDDLRKINSSKDVACNLSIMFSLRDTRPDDALEFVESPIYLDMTVTNRSNDLILGMLGANYVHFSILQEYMAAHLGVEVGVYNQMSNNCHAYVSNFKPEEWLNWERLENGLTSVYGSYGRELKTVPLIKDPLEFDEELPEFVELHKGVPGPDFREADPTVRIGYGEPFLGRVASPMMRAFHAHKIRDYKKAMGWVERIEADDWRIAAQNWIRKRELNFKQKGVEDASI